MSLNIDWIEENCTKGLITFRVKCEAMTLNTFRVKQGYITHIFKGINIQSFSVLLSKYQIPRGKFWTWNGIRNPGLPCCESNFYLGILYCNFHKTRTITLFSLNNLNSTPSFPPFPSLRAVRSHRPDLKGKHPIWNEYWSHSLHLRSPNWGFPVFFSAVK